jgi:hypothetical protein
MNQPTEQAIRQVVEEVLAKLGKAPRTSNGNGHISRPAARTWGVFSEVDHAVAAAQDGFAQLQKLTLDERAKII